MILFIIKPTSKYTETILITLTQYSFIPINIQSSVNHIITILPISAEWYLKKIKPTTIINKNNSTVETQYLASPNAPTYFC